MKDLEVVLSLSSSLCNKMCPRLLVFAAVGCGYWSISKTDTEVTSLLVIEVVKESD